MKSRADALRAIESNPFDLCVIGGGATGSGCALDAQLRGLRTVLLEAADFASGASSASTKMVHGGVRYLEQAVRHLDPAEYKLVHRALRERKRMIENAPFLTRTIEFITPCFNRLDAAYFWLGLKLYDRIAGEDRLSPSYFISCEETLRRLSALNPKNLVGAVVYTDGQFDDARYNIVLAQTFTAAGGEALNYARVIAFEKDMGGKLAGAEVQDHLSQQRFCVRARAFVNATGARADSIREMASPGIPHRMRTSKGAHVVVPLEMLSGCDAMLIPKTEDGRVLFAIPWMGRLLVGTTDEEVAGSDDLSLTKEDVEYLLRHLNKYLAAPVNPNQVVSGFAGARPLVNSRESKGTKRLARDHEVEFDPATGLISIMGGKWTTYRAMAEDTINAVQKYVGGGESTCSTRHRALAGSDGYTPEHWRRLVSDFAVSELTARHLSEKFGTHAGQVLRLLKTEPELAAPLVEGLAPIRAEVAYAARYEMSASIEDFLARRIGLEIYGWKEAAQAAPGVAELLAKEFGWAAMRKREALDRYTERLQSLKRKAGLPPEPRAVS